MSIRVQHHEPKAILGSKLPPWRMEGGLEEGVLLSRWGRGEQGFLSRRREQKTEHTGGHSVSELSCFCWRILHVIAWLFPWENQNIWSALTASAVCEVTLFLSRTKLCPITPTSWIMKGQIYRQSEGVCYFGSYPPCRALSRFYAQFNNLGKTRRSLNLTLLVAYGPSHDGLFQETLCGSLSLNTQARNGNNTPFQESFFRLWNIVYKMWWKW